jgi:hypothetical protein
MRAFLLGLREPDATFDDDGAAREKMSVDGTKLTIWDVRSPAAVG